MAPRYRTTNLLAPKFYFIILNKKFDGSERDVDVKQRISWLRNVGRRIYWSEMLNGEFNGSEMSNNEFNGSEILFYHTK